MTCQGQIETHLHTPPRPKKLDIGVSERRPCNDAPVAKDATETTEENTVLNGNVPAATDVDGTVNFRLVDDVTEGSLTFNDDGSLRSLRQRLR
ncbi:Ig-like domain-containing protein [Vibrio lentus]|nr:Ig-like domain-containing protein [Vibrio lentus]